MTEFHYRGRLLRTERSPSHPQVWRGFIANAFIGNATDEVALRRLLVEAVDREIAHPRDELGQHYPFIPRYR